MATYFLNVDMGFGHPDHTNAYTRFFAKGSLNTSRLILNQVDSGKVDIVLHIGKSFLGLNLTYN